MSLLERSRPCRRSAAGDHGISLCLSLFSRSRILLVSERCAGITPFGICVGHRGWARYWLRGPNNYRTGNKVFISWTAFFRPDGESAPPDSFRRARFFLLFSFFSDGREDRTRLIERCASHGIRIYRKYTDRSRIDIIALRDDG